VCVALDGPSALEVLRGFQSDCILLDIGLPGVNGWDLAPVLREHAAGRPLLLVAVTGYGTEQDKARSRAAGFDAHILKPAEPDELQRLLADAKNAKDRAAALGVF